MSCCSCANSQPSRRRRSPPHHLFFPAAPCATTAVAISPPPAHRWGLLLAFYLQVLVRTKPCCFSHTLVLFYIRAPLKCVFPTLVQVYSVKDLFPGQLLDVTVLDATPAGLVVQITQNLKALVPKTHMTDAGVLPEGSKLPSKLKAGKTLPARVLSVDPVHKRVQLTLKKGLVGSKLPVLADLRQAVVGMKLHGVVTGVQRFGVFVGFYGGVSGLLPKPHLDLLPGQEPGDLYSVGQLLRVQVGLRVWVAFGQGG